MTASGKTGAVLRKPEFLDSRTKTREKIQYTKEVKNARSGACWSLLWP
jgi:hypothetical protein